LKTRFVSSPQEFVLSEFQMSESDTNGLFQVTMRFTLNERRVRWFIDRILAKKSGKTVKPRLLISIDDRTGHSFASAVQEQFNSRGLFDIRDPEVLGRIVDTRLRNKMDSGTLSLNDIDALQSGSSLAREVDFIVLGVAVPSTRTTNGDVEASVSVSGLRIVDLSTGQVIASATDSVSSISSDVPSAINSSAVKAARVLTPRITDQLMKRWAELLSIKMEIEGFNWFSPEGERFYSKVIQACGQCRGNPQRTQGKTRNSARVQLRFQGDLFSFVKTMRNLSSQAGFPVFKVGDVNEASGLVHLIVR